MNTQRIIINIYFRESEFLVDDIIKNLLNHYATEISEFYFDGENHEIKDLKLIFSYVKFKAGSSLRFKIIGKRGQTIGMVINWECLSLSISVDTEQYYQASELVPKLLVLYEDDFIFGKENDYFFNKRQNETDISNYELLYGPLPVERTVFGQFNEPLYIDITNTPGREVWLRGMWISAAWKIYLSDKIIRYLDIKDAVEAFPFYKRRFISPGIIEAQLFDSAFDAEIEKNLTLQDEIKKILRIDYLLSLQQDQVDMAIIDIFEEKVIR